MRVVAWINEIRRAHARDGRIGLNAARHRSPRLRTRPDVHAVLAVLLVHAHTRGEQRIGNSSPPDRRFDNARAFYTWNERQRLRVQTTPMIDVHVVDADRDVPYAQFAGPWRPDLDGLSREDVRPAGCVNSNDAVIFSGRMDKAVLHLRQMHSFHYLLA
jgi:hypothetical protein